MASSLPARVTDADSCVVSAPDFHQCVFFAASDCAPIPEHRAAIVSPISVKTCDVVRGGGVTWAQRTLEPTQSFDIVATYAPPAAQADAKMNLAGGVTCLCTSAKPTGGGVRVWWDENPTVRII
jgi:hypothetical protein